RHTRFSRDWSSDVCSSDLAVAIALLVTAGVVVWQWRAADESRLSLATGTGRSGDGLFTVPAAAQGTDQKLNDLAAVGRAVVAVRSEERRGGKDGRGRWAQG